MRCFVRLLEVGFVCDVDSEDFSEQGNGIVHLFVYAVFERVVVDHRDEVCVDILGQDIPVKRKELLIITVFSKYQILSIFRIR